MLLSCKLPVLFMTDSTFPPLNVVRGVTCKGCFVEAVILELVLLKLLMECCGCGDTTMFLCSSSKARVVGFESNEDAFVVANECSCGVTKCCWCVWYCCCCCCWRCGWGWLWCCWWYKFCWRLVIIDVVEGYATVCPIMEVIKPLATTKLLKWNNNKRMNEWNDDIPKKNLNWKIVK